ncbi:hypothetical protein [Mangrovihabitans endophyticus]|uniref:SCO6045-like C-terminal domain-containing protein n=1 Tax=Mangrovihabitans endophyticus TaxID=1751298 RepID=A0A8J3FL87_9ACTN|nr:hypothetical protein [Mangrovihabitans endophyticus]GGK71792.1 hypothetical protein GCM10012284_01850 [Mangrovihabitans endophyticus]
MSDLTPAGRGATGVPDPATGRPARAGGAQARPGLAARQAALVDALTRGAPVPAGFDARRVEIARVALLRKRAGEVARHWPMMAAGLGPGWLPAFSAWAAARPTRGSLRDGWDLARELLARRTLPEMAAPELAVREATLRYDIGGLRPRRAPAVRRVAGSVAVQAAGRVTVFRVPERPAGRTR